MKIVRLDDRSVIDDLNPVTNRHKIVFYPSNDTISFSFLEIIKRINQINDTSVFIWLPKRNHENASLAFDQNILKAEIITFSPFLFFKNRPEVIIMANDWGNDSKFIIAIARVLKIPTLCIQESVIDFGDKLFRMQWSDNVAVQGKKTLHFLNRKSVFLVGNPRYEKLISAKPPKSRSIMINCNFTYGVFEDIRDRWLNDIITIINRIGASFFIAQHPRDKGDILKFGKVVKTNASNIHDRIRKAYCVISRFSSVIHEALILGRKVIYYNPHCEKMYYDFDFNKNFIFHAKNKDELEFCISTIFKDKSFDRHLFKIYSANHFFPTDSEPSKKIADIILYEKLLINSGRHINIFNQLVIFIIPGFLKRYLKRKVNKGR